MTDRNIKGFKPLTEDQEMQIKGGNSVPSACMHIFEQIRVIKEQINTLNINIMHTIEKAVPTDRGALQHELSVLEHKLLECEAANQ